MERIHDIRAFLAIVDQGSQTGAARQLGRSVQSVSRSLALLERSLGVQLIRRNTRQSSTTEVGLTYYRGMQRALAEFDAARLEATSQQSMPRGVLRITAPVQFAPAFVVPLVAAFMQRYAAMEVELVASDRFSDLIEDNLDLAIRIGDLPDSELAAKRLGEVRLVVAGAHAYFAQHGRPRRPEDLVRHQCLARTTNDNDAQWLFRIDGKLKRIKVGGRFRADSTAAIYAAVTEGMGLCFTPRWQIQHLLDSSQVELVLEDFEPPRLPIHAVWPAAKGSFARAKLFSDFAAEYLSFKQL